MFVNHKTASIAILILSLAIAVGVVEGQSASVAERREPRIMNCNLESTGFDDCDLIGYVIRVGVFAAPGIILAVFMFLACPMYCGGKYCCNCCGGRNQTPNFCCPNTELPARYSSGDLLRPKILALICLAIAVAAVIWGVTGTLNMLQGLSDFGANIVATPALIQQQIDEIDAALVVTVYDPTTNTNSTRALLSEPGGPGAGTLTEATAAKNDLDSQVNTYMGDYQARIDQFANVMWAIFAVPLVIIMLGFIAAIANCRRYFPMTLVWILFLLGFLMWIIHALFSGISMIVGDFCAEVQGLARKQLNLVSILIGCDDTQFAGFKQNFRSLEAQESENTCNSIARLCYDPTQTVAQNVAAGTVYNCPLNPGLAARCSGIAFATLFTYMDTVFYIHPNIVGTTEATVAGAACRTPANVNSCTLEKCSRDCTDANGVLTTLGRSSLSAWLNFIAARTVSNTIDTLGARFSTCDSILQIIIAPFDAPCDNLVGGMVYDRQATGLLGLSIIGAIFIFAWGAKRFLPLRMAEVAQTDQDTPVEELQG